MSSRWLLLVAAAVTACGPPPEPAPPQPAAAPRSLVALPVESAAFPRSAQVATALLGRARIRGVDPPTMSKVPLEVIQLSIECVDATLDCYVAVAKSLSANLLLFGEIEPGPREGELRVTISLLDVDGKRWVRRSTKLFASELDASYDMRKVVNDATRP